MDDLLAIQEVVDGIYVDEKIKDVIVRMVHATRPGTRWFDKKREGIIVAGASPRASIWLFKLARFRAFMEGKDFVTPEHVLAVVPSVLGHRVIPSYEAVLEKTNMRQLVKEIALSAL